MVVDAAGAAEELEVVVVVLSEVRRTTHRCAVQLCLLLRYGPVCYNMLLIIDRIVWA